MIFNHMNHNIDRDFLSGLIAFLLSMMLMAYLLAKSLDRPVEYRNWLTGKCEIVISNNPDDSCSNLPENRDIKPSGNNLVGAQ